MWSADMNSFNHYAYGAVADWMYGVMAGIRTDDCQPGFQRIIFQPRTDQRIGFVKASIESMKLMNEVQSEIEGTVAEILVGNGEAVEYDQPILRVE